MSGRISFAELLRYHLESGTRPRSGRGRIGDQWNVKDFSTTLGVTDRTVRNWLNGKVVPDDLSSINRVLFGVENHDAGVLEEIKRLRTVANTSRRRGARRRQAQQQPEINEIITVTRVTDPLSEDFSIYELLYESEFLVNSSAGVPITDVLEWLEIAKMKRAAGVSDWDLFIYIAKKGSKAVGLLQYETYRDGEFAFVTYFHVAQGVGQSDNIGETLLKAAARETGQASISQARYVFFDLLPGTDDRFKEYRFNVLANKLRPGCKVYEVCVDFLEPRHDLSDPNSSEHPQKLYIIFMDGSIREAVDREEARRFLDMVYNGAWGYQPKLNKTECQRYREYYSDLFIRIAAKLGDRVTLRAVEKKAPGVKGRQSADP